MVFPVGLSGKSTLSVTAKVISDHGQQQAAAALRKEYAGTSPQEGPRSPALLVAPALPSLPTLSLRYVEIS